MAAEGAIALVAGVLASSIALIGFGIDSSIEGIASVIIIWRLSGTRTLSELAERRAQQLVAVSFFLPALYVAVEAISGLATGSKPGVHAASTAWDVGRADAAELVEQIDRVLAPVSGEVAVVAIDHAEARSHVARELEG